MTQPFLTPLPLKNKLAGNPNREPTYSVTVKTPEGPLKIADPKAVRCLIALMDMNAVIGGAASHYGGPAGFAELMSALHGYVFTESQNANQPWHERFHLVNDAGHCENGLYALKALYGFADLNLQKLKKFRAFNSPLTGHGEAHLFPEAVFLSNGPLGSAFPQSQGLAMADAFAGNSRVTITALSDGASMEGEAREAMAAIPGLARNGKMAPYVLIISDNNTMLSGRIDKETYSMNPTFESLSTLGWKVIDLADGHDLQKCFDVISNAISEARKNPQTPIAIRAKTIKGIGSKKTAESSSGGHGFPLKSATELPDFLHEIFEGEYPKEFASWITEAIELEKKMKAQQSKPLVPEEKIQTGISSALIKALENGFPVVSVTSDLPGSTGVGTFRKEFPLASFDVGVAESNMISTAAGFSKVGFIPVVDTFAQFGSTKGALPLIMASLSDAPMICVFSHTGFQDAADGASHQSLSYLALLSSIPQVDVYCLTCSEEAESLMTQTIEKFAQDRKAGKVPPTTVFFLGRENFPKSFSAGAEYHLRKAQIVKETTGSKYVTILASGSCVSQAVEASEKMKASGIGSILINPGRHNHLDLVTLQNALKKTEGRLVVIEDHQKIGGLAQMVAFELSEQAIPFRIRSLAVHGEFGQSAYTANELYEKHGLTAASIAKASQELISK